MTRRINAAGLSHIRQREGKRNVAYRDVANVLAIAYGHTSAAGIPKVHEGMRIRDQEAEEILRQDLLKFEERVEHLVKSASHRQPVRRAVKIGAGAILGAARISDPAYLSGKSAGKIEAATVAL